MKYYMIYGKHRNDKRFKPLDYSEGIFVTNRIYASMFSYELANNEYGCTYELNDTLDCLGLVYEEIQAKPNLKRGLELALNKYK